MGVATVARIPFLADNISDCGSLKGFQVVLLRWVPGQIGYDRNALLAFRRPRKYQVMFELIRFSPENTFKLGQGLICRDFFNPEVVFGPIQLVFVFKESPLRLNESVIFSLGFLSIFIE